ncbi:unnamed protein product [Bursaphelenchus xylophilus]|uniref:THO complex subunit 2 n=1 Tax=Bursaphelenchus xylophilus TaxID=6326 RepID=A0A1I7RLQ9_BURXY|nr:unnamed protein product [Bursaphelenchus xylophilus]CAG9082683.1 unnamed protein product [Bursaphelenchus xylophilus]
MTENANESADVSLRIDESLDKTEDLEMEEPKEYEPVSTEITTKLMDLVENVILNDGDINNAIEDIKTIDSPLVRSQLSDVYGNLSLISLTADQSKKAIELGKAIAQNFVPEDVLKVDCPAMGANEIKGKIVKTRTKVYYKQTKFNLLREESEGFSKLITELLTPIEEDALWVRISQLIGQFNLDPNRVLDIILECFACELGRKDVFVGILRRLRLSKEVLRDMVTLKFIFYQRAGHTSNSFYKMAVILCLEDLLDMLQLFQRLAPDQQKLIEDSNNSKAMIKQRAQKAEKISTIAAMEIQSQNPSTSQSSQGQESSSNQVTFESAIRAQISEDHKFSAELFDEYDVLGKNQKLGFLVAALELGSLSIASQLLSYFPHDYIFGKSRRAREGLTRILGYIIDDFYREKNPSIWESHPARKRTWDSFIEKPAKVSNWAEFEERAVPLVKLLGPNVGCVAEVATKLARLLKIMLEDPELNKTPENTLECNEKVNQLVDFALLPGLTIAEPMYKYGEEVWILISRLPYHQRYRMYGRWKTVNTVPYYLMQLEKGMILGRARYLMKRLSKDTVKLIGRQLGKLCLNHPTIALDYLLTQVQTFQNLIDPVVESLRYLSELAFDVLTYTLIENLADPAKQSLKTGDGTLSPWLSALAAFTGSIYKRYAIEYEGLLQYIVNQLKDKKSVDLLVLREVITAIGGVDQSTNLTEEHVQGLMGGELLKQETFTSLAQKSNRKAVTRLKEALQNADLSVSLAILMAQQRDCIVHQETKQAPVKLSCQILDECQSTFLQFVNFLRTNVKMEDYSKRFPQLSDLMTRFKLAPETAFHLARPIYWFRAQSSFELTKKLKKETTEKKKVDSETKNELYKEAMGQVLISVEEELVRVKDSEFWKDISAKLFTMFWMLSANDLEVSKAAYEREIEKIKKQLEAATNSDASKKKQIKEEERLKTLEAKLRAELNKMEEHVARVNQLLVSTKELLFATASSAQNNRFLQVCVIPRAVFSEIDAVFCAKLIMTIHSNRTSYFQTMILMDKIFYDISVVLIALTENEAANFGKFLSLLLEKVMYWHGDKEIFDKECLGFPGFLTKIRNSSGEFDYFGYKNVCHKWQSRISKAAQYAINNGSYLLCRNMIVVLKKILNHFPIIKTYETNMIADMEALRDREKGKREDLSVLATSYLINLKKRKAHIFTVEEFKGTPKKVKNEKKEEKKEEKKKEKKSEKNGKEKSETPSTPTQKQKRDFSGDEGVMKKAKTISPPDTPSSSNSKNDEKEKETKEKEVKERAKTTPKDQIRRILNKENERDKGKDKEDKEKNGIKARKVVSPREFLEQSKKNGKDREKGGERREKEKKEEKMKENGDKREEKEENKVDKEIKDEKKTKEDTTKEIKPTKPLRKTILAPEKEIEVVKEKEKKDSSKSDSNKRNSDEKIRPSSPSKHRERRPSKEKDTHDRRHSDRKPAEETAKPPKRISHSNSRENGPSMKRARN